MNFEYFFNISPKIIETFDFAENISTSNNIFSLKDIPSKVDINVTKVGGLSEIQQKINSLKQKQSLNQQKINTLKDQITG